MLWLDASDEFWNPTASAQGRQMRGQVLPFPDHAFRPLDHRLLTAASTQKRSPGGVYVGPRNPAGVRGGQEGGNIGDILGFAEATVHREAAPVLSRRSILAS